MKNIDRWVIGAAMSFCAARKPHRVFVRMSHDSMRDQTLGTWLQQQLKASGVEPSAHRHRDQRGARDPSTSRRRANCARCVTHLGFEFRHRELRLRPRLRRRLLRHLPVELREDRRRADAGPRQRPPACRSRSRRWSTRARAAKVDDDRRARRGREHDGRAVAARRRVRAGLLRLEPGGSGAGRTDG